MDEYKLTNPLSITERVSIIRLQGHDTQGSHTMVLNVVDILQNLSKPDTTTNTEEKWAEAKKNIERLSTHPRHIFQTQETVNTLGTKDRLVLYNDSPQTFLDNKELIKQLRILNQTLHDEIEINPPSGIPPFLSPVVIWYSAMHNLAKNARVAQNTVNGNVKPRLSLETVDEIPKSTLYVPNDANNYTQFVRFRVENQGEFPRNKALIERLAGSIPPLGAKGYGLRFVGMASKALRAPVHIETGNGQTSVDFYHPIYKTDRRLSK